MKTSLASLERPDFTKIDNRAPSVAHMFLDRVAATPHAEAFRYPQDHSWESVTWQQVGERVYNIAGGLISLGIAPEDRVALASSTRYEWVLVDFAVMCAGAATTTVYPTTNAGDVAYIVANSGSRVAVAENQTQVDKLLEHRAELPEVGKVVIIVGTSRASVATSGAICTPALAIARVRAGSMSKPTTRQPALTRLWANAPPMMPSPTTPTRFAIAALR